MRRRGSANIPEDLRIYDPAKYRAEALPDETVFYGRGPVTGSVAYYRALKRAGVREDLASHLQAVAWSIDARAERDPDNADWRCPRELHPFGGSMYGRPRNPQ